MVTGDRQLKSPCLETTMSYQHTHQQKGSDDKDGQHQALTGKESNWNSQTLLVGMQNCMPTLESLLGVPTKAKSLPYDLAIPLLESYHPDIKHMSTKGTPTK